MRRGHRLDNLDSTWTTTADRPWYPPLYTEGFPKPSEVGDRIRRLSLPIHRVFVSPFLRCVQTAAHVVEALRVDDDDYGERIDLKLPRWGESDYDATSRYKRIIRALADKYPSENLLLVTHGQGVATFSSWLKGIRGHDVHYCGYAHAKRHIYLGDNSSHASGIFELLNIVPDENCITFETSPVPDVV